MTILTGLPAIFGAALAPLAQDGVLHPTTLTDTGTGGVATTAMDVPVKLLVESLSAQDRLGLPRQAVRLMVLRADLPGTIALDDSLTVGGATYRVIQVETDPASAGFTLVGVPA